MGTTRRWSGKAVSDSSAALGMTIRLTWVACLGHEMAVGGVFGVRDDNLAEWAGMRRFEGKAIEAR